MKKSLQTLVLALFLLPSLALSQGGRIGNGGTIGNGGFNGGFFGDAYYYLYANLGVVGQKFPKQTIYSQFDSTLSVRPALSFGFAASADFGGSVGYTYALNFSYFFPTKNTQYIQFGDNQNPDIQNANMEARGMLISFTTALEIYASEFAYVALGMEVGGNILNMDMSLLDTTYHDYEMTLDAFEPTDPFASNTSEFSNRSFNFVVGPSATFRYELEKFDINITGNYLFVPFGSRRVSTFSSDLIVNNFMIRAGIYFPL